MLQTLARTAVASVPETLTIALPWVMSTTDTNPSLGTDALISAERPGVASRVHSSGRDPHTRVPSPLRRLRPYGTARSSAASVPRAARTRIFVVAVSSVRESVPSSEASGPTVTGLLNWISDTLTRSFGIDVGVVFLDRGRDAAAVAEQDRDRRAGCGE